MENQTTKRKNEEHGIEEVGFKRLIKLLGAIEHGVNLMHYLIENNREKAYVLALISAEKVDLPAAIQQQKRKTDILLEVDAEKNLYALLCQGTQVDGGYYFIRRLVDALQETGASNIYCSELEITDARHPVQELAFRLLNMYQHNKKHQLDGEINFRSLK